MALQDLVSLIEGTPYTGVLLYSLAALVVSAVLYETWSWRRLSHVPGPFWNSIHATWWLVRSSVGGAQYRDFMDLQTKYGPLVRIGSHSVMTDDPDVIRRMNAVRSPYSKSRWYYPLMAPMPGHQNVFTIADEEKHAERRSKVAPGYGGKENESMERTVDKIVGHLIGLIESKYVSDPKAGRSRLIDFARTGEFFALDVISELAWGEAFGFVESDEDLHDFMKIYDDFFSFASAIQFLRPLAGLLQTWPFSVIQPSPRDKKGFGKLIGRAFDAVDKRLASNEKKRDMLGSFVSKGLTPFEIRSESALQIIAGADSTASAIRLIMALLMITPSSYRALQSEIDTAILSGKISSPIKSSEAKNLPYLQATIKEGLRMLPPATGLLYKQVPKGGDVVCGFHLPEDTEIGIDMYGIMHSKKFWGEDVDVFRPERWLEAEEEGNEDRKSEMLATSALVFGHGKYECLGKTLAYMELDKVFVELLRRYDIAATNVQNPITIIGAGFYLIHDQLLRITRRKSNPNLAS